MFATTVGKQLKNARLSSEIHMSARVVFSWAYKPGGDYIMVWQFRVAPVYLQACTGLLLLTDECCSLTVSVYHLISVLLD